jgi:ribonuclease HII
VPSWSYEIAAGLRDGQVICGVDEVGRGPLAGPVLACAVILDPALVPKKLQRRLNDSKQLCAPEREDIASALRELVVFAIAQASSAEIDEINILRASHLAMRRAVAALALSPTHALVDGNMAPGLDCPTTCVVQGDALSLSIAAASILAKVERDQIMSHLALTHTVYGWEHNAGYSTAYHMAAIKAHGITAHHRRSFRPVSENIQITD